MPIYEFRCGLCEERFEERRAMRDADRPASCSHGHPNAVRLLPFFAVTGTAPSDSSGCGAGGGCCGGACGAA